MNPGTVRVVGVYLTILEMGLDFQGLATLLASIRTCQA